MPISPNSITTKQNDSSPRQFDRRAWLKAMGGLIASATGVHALAHRGTPPSASVGIATTTAKGSGPKQVSKIALGQAVACMACDSCMPCGYGIDIPGNFTFYNNMLKGNAVPDMSTRADRTSREWAKKAKTFLKRYDSAIPDRHQSQRCIKCFHCAMTCPNHVFIVNELAELTKITDDLRDWECRN